MSSQRTNDDSPDREYAPEPDESRARKQEERRKGEAGTPDLYRSAPRPENRGERLAQTYPGQA